LDGKSGGAFQYLKVINGTGDDDDDSLSVLDFNFDLVEELRKAKDAKISAVETCYSISQIWILRG
jgi:hypothetical protein